MSNKTLKVLSIDAWRDNGLWSWNNWLKVAAISSEDFQSIKSDRQAIKVFRDKLGLLSESSKGKVRISDDGYNLILEDRSNGRPLYAIEYGSEIY